MKNQVLGKDPVCLQANSSLNSNKAMAASGGLLPELQTAHSNAHINVCDYNLLHNYFLHMFEKSEDIQPQKDKCKKCKKSKKNGKTKEKCVEPLSSLYATVPEIQISKNASWFAMFASVRKTCLEHQSRAASILQAAASSSWGEGDTDLEVLDTELGKVNLPKIVGIGLKAVFDIIRDTETLHPGVCQRGLQSLLDVLQGLCPEDLRDEPTILVDTMFHLLLDLSSRTGEPIAVNGNLEDGAHIRALACSCLLALSVAGGSSQHLLQATSAILMSPRSHAGELISLPGILAAVQRSVFSVIIRKTDHPDYMSHGIPVSSLVNSFRMNLKDGASNQNPTCLSMASDGHYLYLHTNLGLFKVGSGFSGTVRGHVYKHKPDMFIGSEGWIGFSSNTLFYKSNNLQNIEIIVLNKETLEKIKTVSSSERFPSPHLMLSDGDHVGIVTPSRDDTLSIKFLSLNSNPMSVVADLPIKLARKCVEAFGSSLIEENGGERTQLDFGIDEEIAQVGIGREFALLLTTGGKLYYTGKSSSIGHKHPCAQGKWSEVQFSKSESSSAVIVNFSIGLDGNHALLIGDEGAVYFTGTPKRGEDGDQSSKPRRPPKAKKPSKISRMDKQGILCTACNSGTSCMVTKKGELYVFGKDSSYADFSTGRVLDLANQTITGVSIGKAHIVVLSSNGDVFTFGINNKGQCGREFPVIPPRGEAGAEGEDISDHEVDLEAESVIPGYVLCLPGKHCWKHEQCMVCSVCAECTGYGASCVSANRPDRSPGTPCGCGSGDSGCSECGCCRTCAGEGINDLEGVGGVEVAAGGEGAGGAVPVVNLIRLNLMASKQSRNRDYRDKFIKRRLAKLGKESRRSKNGVKYVDPCSAVALPEKKGSVKEVPKEEQEKDLGKVSSLGPGKVLLPADCRITAVSCGLHHTLLLSSSGLVLSFGSNSYGQLGVGDLIPRGAPVPVTGLDEVVTRISGGGYHSVALTCSGRVLTWGNNAKGQLGRSAPPPDSKLPPVEIELWYSFPGVIPGLGVNYGKGVTWIYASSDQTLFKLDESLINAQNLRGASIVANKHQVLLLPTQNIQQASFNSLCISRTDGFCRSFSSIDQVEWTGKAVALDPLYNTIWSYTSETGTIQCHNPIATDIDVESKQSIMSPDLALPVNPGCLVSRSQAALNLLSCLDTVTGAAPSNLTQPEEDSIRLNNMKSLTKEDFCVVSRFDSHGGGWGYSGHSIEAVRFTVDTDILVGGYGLFGGRGEYVGKIKLFDLGVEGGDQEGDGDLLAESEEVTYECGARQKYPILFEEPVPILTGRWYVAWARVSGPSSDCGSSGQGTVTTEDQVQFSFKSSKKSNNGTDVNAGQIPQILFRIVTQESTGVGRKYSPPEPIYILSSKFGKPVTVESFQALLSLLQWAWSTFKVTVGEVVDTSPSQAALMDLHRLVFICRACLRLLVSYIEHIYPSPTPISDAGVGKQMTETQRLAESVCEVRTQLVAILSDPLPILAGLRNAGQPVNMRHRALEMSDLLLKDAHKTFVSCFHAFYPTGPLKWICLCSLLSQVDGKNSDMLLAAAIDALCNPMIKLRSIFPIGVNEPEKNQYKESPVENVSVTGSVLFLGEMSPTCKYPLLSEVMNYQSQSDASKFGSWTFSDVLSKLLSIVSQPVEQALQTSVHIHSKELVNKSCRLIASVISELSNIKNGSESGMASIANRLSLQTPNRFGKVNSSRTWNTGNGSPDAICFSVDRAGILMAGAAIYGGAGSFDYELELLRNQTNREREKDSNQSQRWISMEMCHGTYTAEECSNDLYMIRFDKPVTIHPHTKYALRLRNHGGQTCNGDEGLASVKGSDGTTFSFSSCSLSFNGTNHSRGQIPHLLYYSSTEDQSISATTVNIAQSMSHKSALSITVTVVNTVSQLLSRATKNTEGRGYEILNSAPIITTLLPHVMASVSGLACSDPVAAVQVISLIQDLLPKVAELNNQMFKNNVEVLGADIDLPAPHYSWVESEHPYKPAGISNYRVVFPPSVKWMAIEFDSACCTAQAEDSLQMYIRNPSSQRPKNLSSPLVTSQSASLLKSQRYSPVLTKFSGNKGWPSQSVVLPGNEVLFSLETASDYVKGENKVSNYGFKCLVAGYEVQDGTQEGLKSIEHELAYLGGLCASSLMNKSIKLPLNLSKDATEDQSLIEASAQELYESYPTLLMKGFAIDELPTIHQALSGNLPLNCQSNERMFLKDFVFGAPGTAGGRLASWLQPESYISVDNCGVMFKPDEMRCSWPTIITILTRDQYGSIANVPNMKVEVKAIPIDEMNSSSGTIKLNKALQPDSMTFGGHSPPNLDTKYEVTVKEKMFYHAITVNKAYDNYSFEELRWASPKLQRQSENMLVRPNGDGTYSANWTPGNVGWYKLHVSLDGCNLPVSHKVEILEPPQGKLPPTQPYKRTCPSAEINRLRQFIAKPSAGLRIRLHPTLQSEQIGIVPVDGTVSIMDELSNSDGIWVRLSVESLNDYCSQPYAEGWCLQYNQHYEKQLMKPIVEPITKPKPTIPKRKPESNSGSSTFTVGIETSSKNSALKRGPGMYTVVKCGSSGHNIRCAPSLSAAPVGILSLGDNIIVNEVREHPSGECWVKFDKDSAEKYCFGMIDGDVWSLAVTATDTHYLESEAEIQEQRWPNVIGNFESKASSFLSPFGIGEEMKNVWGPGLPLLPSSSNSSLSTPFSPLDSSMSGSLSKTFELSPSTPIYRRKSLPKPGRQVTPPRQPFNQAQGGGKGAGPSTPPRSRSGTLERKSFFQKWFKSDESGQKSGAMGSPSHSRRSSPAEVQRKAFPVNKDIPPELQGVSVKELVKVIGASRANGNGVTPPSTPGTPRKSRSASPAGPVSQLAVSRSRSSSPISIGHGKSLGGQAMYSPRSLTASFGILDDIEVPSFHRQNSSPSDTSDMISSLTRDMSCLSASPGVGKELSGFSKKDGSLSPVSFRSEVIQSEGASSRNVSPIRTEMKDSQIFLLSTSSLDIKEKDVITSSNPPVKIKENSPSVKEKPIPSKPNPFPKPRLSYTNLSGPVTEAMSPSVAESIRAVFAAFIWHSGIVQDTMACASFIKFNPGYVKEGTTEQTPFATTEEKDEVIVQKVKQRHSVEVISASYLNAETSAVAEKYPFNANRNMNIPQNISDLQGLGGAIPKVENPKVSNEVVPGLPQTLGQLVLLWEGVVLTCLDTIISQGPVNQWGKDKLNKGQDKGLKNNRDAGAVFSSNQMNNPFNCEKSKDDKIQGLMQFAGICDNWLCDICGGYFEPPVTYHMKMAHPGCGNHAGGKGYNSSGQYCGGWAGNCGDGGGGGSSWYLICENCRDKHRKKFNGKNELNMKHFSHGDKKDKEKIDLVPLPSMLASFSYATASSPVGPLDCHIVMKANSSFLLDLASSTEEDHSRRTAQPELETVTELIPGDPGSFPYIPFNCLDVLGVQDSELKELNNELLLQDNLQTSLDWEYPTRASSSRNSDGDRSRGVSKDPESKEGSVLVEKVSEIDPPAEFQSDESTQSDRTVLRRSKFHRSYSIGSPKSKEWSPSSSRKRNSSYEDYANSKTSTSSEFLAHTSPAWKRLFEQGSISTKLLDSPVISFIMRWNDLEALQNAMQLTLRKAVCRAYAMQAFNWLLRSVSQPVCLHDLLWCLISSFQDSKSLNEKPKKKDEEKGDEILLGGVKEKDSGFEHPMSDLCLVGGAVKSLPSTFHILLQTISDLMLLLPLGSALQQAAVTCFSIQFWPSDHSFLHQSQVFSTISKILSRGETDLELDHSPKGGFSGAGVEQWKDLTNVAELSVSSRPAMIASLTDGSTETFWESGDEDRNKTKYVSLKCGAANQPRSVSVHVDNGRDIGNKVSSLTFKSGRSIDDLTVLRNVDIESRFAGWVTCFLTDNDNQYLKIEIKGPDNTVRLRQVKLIGKSNDFPSPFLPNRADSQRIQQSNCEVETLRVFRLITSQVFGKLLEPESDIDAPGLDQWDGTDLKEHVVGILFSRSKLSHLQKQVCSHIVSAISKEAGCLRDDWELSLCSGIGSVDQEQVLKLSDTYCFEMLSMVLALSGSKVGRIYLSQQYSLLKDMLSFLHTGSARVQRAVVSVLRRVLPLVPPVRFANILNISSLPPRDFTILNVASTRGNENKELPKFDPHKVGILDIFLGCIAKALSIQVKKKSNSGRSVSAVSLGTCIHPRDNTGARWWLRGSISKKIAEEIILLLKEMTQGKFSEDWTNVSKSGIAEAVLNLTRLEAEQRHPEDGLRCGTLWLATAALTVLHRDHVDGLSSGDWGGGGAGQDRPICDNHDDGETLAIILCDSCGNLCADCDRFLHLNRKTRLHSRQVFKEEEEAIKVNLHEGCGRTKLFWLTAAADSATLKGMIEFREEPTRKGSSLVEAVCRYCGGSSCAALPVHEGVCTEEECQENAKLACTKLNPCGHPCGGLAGEAVCLPCLRRCDKNEILKQDGDDMCMICFTEALHPIPSILLHCGHVFHYNCVRGVLKARWPGPRITFGFTHCPICKVDMNHPALEDLINPINALYQDVKKKALMRLEYEGLSRCEAVVSQGARWFNNPTGFSMDRYAYYVCFKCGKSYFGGEARCDQEVGGGDMFNPEELVCGGCSDVSQAQMCPKHGTDYLEYKCRYCCSVAVFFCFGTTHFCNPCHDDFQRVANIPKGELPQCPVGPKALSIEGDECPLNLKHPPTGEEFALGCGICRNAHTF